MTRRLLAAVLAVTLIAAACGSDDGDDSAAVDTTSDAADEGVDPDDGSADGAASDDGADEGTTDAADDSVGPATGTGPAPTTEDHWHSPYGLFLCIDGWIPPFPVQDDPEGIHTHTDGIIHIHPFSDAAAGENATMGKFMESVGFELTDDAIIVDADNRVDEGYDCDGEPTVLQIARWSLEDLDAEPEIFTENLADVAFTEDLQVFTIAYVPEGAEIEPPPSISALSSITDVDPADIPVLPEGFTVAVVAPPEPGESVEGETPCPTDDSPRSTSFTQAPPTCTSDGVAYTAVFNTSEGVIRVELDTETTPNTVNNFIVLAKYGYYDGTSMFRTDTSIDIIQGGAPTTNTPSDPGPGYTIPDEGGEFVTDATTGQYTGPFTYEPGDLVMARSAGPDSSGAQFFFSAGPDTALLDSQGTYLRFGRTIEGLDVLESILGLHVDDPASGLGGGPSSPVMVESVVIEES